MEALLYALQGVAGLGSLVCFIMVIIKMFQNDATGVGIASLVLFLVCGIGMLLAFIYGWMKAAEWNINNLMLAWTGCILVGMVTGGLMVAMGGPS
jgi:hypothetical protein